MLKKNLIYGDTNCPVTASMEVIGGKWKLLLISRIYQDSPARFGVLKRSLPGITQTMLTMQLRELEDDGIVKREIFAEMPPRVEYTLTEYGLTLKPLIQLLSDWGRTHRLSQEK